MTNPKRGEMQLQLGSQTFNARVTMDGLAKIETACGCGILKVLEKLTEGDLTTSEMVAVLLPIIRSGGNDLNIKDMQGIVWDAGLAASMKAVGEILATALGAGENEGNEEQAA